MTRRRAAVLLCLVAVVFLLLPARVGWCGAAVVPGVGLQGVADPGHAG